MEGDLGLAQRGFQQELRLAADATGLVLLYDNAFEQGACTQTIVQHATPGASLQADWQMREEQRLAVPLTPECEGRREPPRPGTVLRRGDTLEVYVQRSVLCNGYEVKMVYAPLPAAPRTDDQLVRHFVAFANRRDAGALASLFAEAGSLLEPFTITETNEPARHDGREAIRAWFGEAFGPLPWVAMRLTGIAPGAQAGQLVATWEYMDPRVRAPFAGRSTFTVGAGEIFEMLMELTGQPELVAQGATPAPSEAAGTPEAAASPPAEPAPRRTRPARPARSGAPRP